MLRERSCSKARARACVRGEFLGWSKVGADARTFARGGSLEEDVDACEQLPAVPPQHVGLTGGSRKDDEIVSPANLTYTKMAFLSRIPAPASRSKRMKGEWFQSVGARHSRIRAANVRGGEEVLLLGGSCRGWGNVGLDCELEAGIARSRRGAGCHCHRPTAYLSADD